MSNLPAHRDTTRAVSTTGNALVPYQEAQALEWDDPRRLRRSVNGPFWAGMAILVFFVGAFGYWAASVPLSGGALAPGTIAPEGSRRTVQHYEGGIVRKLWVDEGQTVEKGAPLLVLADVASQSKHDAYIAKRESLLAKKARLDAEKSGEARIAFPDSLSSQNLARETVASQTRIFAARKLEFEARQSVLSQRLRQLSAQISGYQALIDSQNNQLKFLRQEADAKERLLRKGFARLPDALRLRRMIAESLGRLGELHANINGAQQKQMETEFELRALKTERAARIAVEFDEVSNELREIVEKIRATEDVLKRRVVRAPVTGRVVNMRVKTIGGVVRRGDGILDIVPTDERLLVEARLSPLDIDVVHEGLTAEVSLTAYAGASTPRIKGTVLMVSADSKTNEQSGNKPYYLAKVAVEKSELAKIGKNVRLTPGMPADVMIVTGDRTMLSYLLQPFRDAFHRSFREST